MLVVSKASSLYTCSNSDPGNPLGLITDGTVVFSSDGAVLYVGPSADVPHGLIEDGATVSSCCLSCHFVIL